MAAPTVLFLPGLLEDADGFQKQIDSIGPRATCVVGDAQRFSVVAHSMGGYVALELMRQAPRRVERLALLQTNARADSAEATDNRKRLMGLAEKDFPAVISTLMPKLLLEEHRSDTAIVGTTKPERWQQNAALLVAGSLPAREMDRIRARWAEVAAASWVGQV